MDVSWILYSQEKPQARKESLQGVTRFTGLELQRSLGRFKFQEKTATLIQFGINPESPPHAFNGLADEGQACAAAFAQAKMAALEEPKNAALHVLGDSLSVIGHAEADSAVDRFGPDVDEGEAARRDISDRIVEQVEEASLDQTFIPEHPRKWTAERDSAIGRVELHCGADHVAEEMS